MISVVVFPDPNVFLCIPASVADAAAVYPKGINTLLASGVSTFFISGNPVFNKGPTNLPRNPPDCIIFDNRVFESLMSVDELLVKALRILETCMFVSNNSCGKLVLSLESPIMLGDNPITTSISFFIADFDLLSCEFDSFVFKRWY